MKIVCDYCKEEKPPKPNSNVWHGFKDGDTGHTVCYDCRSEHYLNKFKDKALRGHYTEYPIQIHKTMNAILKIQKNQIGYLFKLFPEELKESHVERSKKIMQFSSEGHTSIKKLTFKEANDLIEHYGGKPLKYQNWAYYNVENAAHRAIMSACYELEWTYFNEQRNKIQVNQYVLSEWLKSEKSPVRKPITRMEKEELSKVIEALRSMVKKDNEKKAKQLSASKD